MENKIEIYQTKEGETAIEVLFENDTVWLTQQQMAELGVVSANRRNF